MTTRSPAALSTVDDVADRVRAVGEGLDAQAAVAFTTRQGARHRGRRTAYRNEVVSVRVGDAVGSCAIEPGEVGDAEVFDVVGCTVGELLDHPRRALRVAALDAYLMAGRPFAGDAAAAAAVTVPAGDSLTKSMTRARAVVRLLRPGVGRVAVVGVVNSLLRALREAGIGYVPCDFKGGRTEWDEPVHTAADAALDGADAILASGMTLGNGTFEPLLSHARAADIPLVLFAQTGAAIGREFLGAGVSGLSAEPYPFFWLAGCATDIYLYRAAGPR
jgi:hypothetical protein